MDDNVKVTRQNLVEIAEWVSKQRFDWMDVYKEIIETIIKKNHDYGDAWQKYGIFTPLIRMNDKLLRVKTLSGGEKALVASENIKDTLVDIIAYSLLALLRIRWEEEQYKANIINAGTAQRSLFPEDILKIIEPNNDSGKE